MLTIFSCPKPFEGQIGIIQRNAIESWRRLDPSVEIILFGDAAGTSEIAGKFHAHQITDIKKNDFGTPLLDDIFKKAHTESRNELLCYVNADIILLQDFLKAVKYVRTVKNNFLLVGQRWDSDINSPWDFSGSWEDNLHKYLKNHAKLHPATGSDYFVFPRQLFPEIPAFAIGRAGWDNWMIYHGSERGIPVIDITPVTTVVHQNHDYCHVQQSIDQKFENPESVQNRTIIGDPWKIFVLDDAMYFLTSHGLKRNILKRFFRSITRAEIFLYSSVRRFLTK